MIARHRAPTVMNSIPTVRAEEKTSLYNEAAGILSFIQDKRPAGCWEGVVERDKGCGTRHRTDAQFRDRITQPFGGGAPKSAILVIIRFRVSGDPPKGAHHPPCRVDLTCFFAWVLMYDLNRAGEDGDRSCGRYFGVRV